MSVLARHELNQSPLADLHALASELGIEGFRALRRERLIDAILDAQGGEPETPTSPAAAVAIPQAGDEEAGDAIDGDAGEVEAPDAGDSEGGDAGDGGDAAGVDRGEAELDDGAAAEEAPAALAEPLDGAAPSEQEPDAGADVEDEDEDDEPRRGRGRRRRNEDEDEPDAEDDVRTGVLDVLGNGSGFLRPDPFAHSRDDVYVSPAQIRRCELRPGDEIAGPVRPPRRSERYPSLVRVDSVNGSAAEPPESRPHFDELTPVFASERLAAGEALVDTPFGRGSRVAIGGAPGAGATTLLREVVASVGAGHPEVEVSVVLAGVRPEEVTEWRRAGTAPVAGGGFDEDPDDLAQAASMALERAKRVAERGGHALLAVDGLDALPPSAARRLFAAARATEEAGTLTIVAATGASGELQRMATTRIVLGEDGRPGPGSGTLRADLLGG